MKSLLSHKIDNVSSSDLDFASVQVLQDHNRMCVCVYVWCHLLVKVPNKDQQAVMQDSCSNNCCSQHTHGKGSPVLIRYPEYLRETSVIADFKFDTDPKERTGTKTHSYLFLPCDLWVRSWIPNIDSSPHVEMLITGLLSLITSVTTGGSIKESLVP